MTRELTPAEKATQDKIVRLRALREARDGLTAKRKIIRKARTVPKVERMAAPREEEPIYYFAYGSNLNKEQMSRRCPRAVPIGPMILPKARLVFRGVADVEYDADSSAPGGLWKLTKACEAALDRYEGVSNGLYDKRYIEISLKEKGKPVVRKALLYVMNRDWYAPPGDWYAAIIRQGYRDFGLDNAALTAAIAEARRYAPGKYDFAE